MIEKIEGIAQANGNTLVVANDNDDDIGTFDANGRNQGTGVKSRILLVEHALLKAQHAR